MPALVESAHWRDLVVEEEDGVASAGFARLSGVCMRPTRPTPRCWAPCPRQQCASAAAATCERPRWPSGSATGGPSGLGARGHRLARERRPGAHVRLGARGRESRHVGLHRPRRGAHLLRASGRDRWAVVPGFSPAIVNALRAAECEAARRPRPRGARLEPAPAVRVALLVVSSTTSLTTGWSQATRRLTSLRCDDTAGVSPQCDPGGGSRAGGQAREVEIERSRQVGRSCRVESRERTRTGFALLAEDFGGARDCCPAPGRGLRWRAAPASALQRVLGLPRSLQRSLRRPGPEPLRLLHLEVAVLWSEPSDLEGLDSWWLALGCGTSRRSFLVLSGGTGSRTRPLRAPRLSLGAFGPPGRRQCPGGPPHRASALDCEGGSCLGEALVSGFDEN